MKLIAGNSNKPLAEEIAKLANGGLTETLVTRFADNEIWVEVKDNVRGEDVFIIQSTCNPANDNLMELLVLIDACKRASAGRITAVIPYYGYGRQDRKSKSRTPITAKLVANMIETAGANRVLTMDLHAGQIQGFFDVPVDDLKSKPLFANSLSKSPMMKTTAGNGVIVSPDAGGVPRARSLAKVLNCDIAIIDKRRDKANESEAMNVIGNVRGKQCIIVDDIVDTGGTLIKAAQALSREGAEIVEAYITHGVLSKDGAERMSKDSALAKLHITDTIPNEESQGIDIISVAGIFSEAIRRINHDESISVLFEKTG